MDTTMAQRILQVLIVHSQEPDLFQAIAPPKRLSKS
jgi:hypothetical protein